MIELEEGLYSLLTSDTAVIDAIGGTRIYNTLAPQGTARPYVVFYNNGGGPENIYPGKLASITYLVKAVADDIATAGAIDRAAYDALHHGEGTLSVTGYTPLRVLRTNEVQMPERLQDGRIVFHYGAYYRFRLDD
jgi:hypothetical protein